MRGGQVSEFLCVVQARREPILWVMKQGEGPLVATALHSGHQLRPELAKLTALDEDTRLREEDPFSDFWTEVGDFRILPLRSRFEADFNRERAEAVYRKPQDSWGLKVWKRPPDPAAVKRSLQEYDAFYEELKVLLEEMEKRHGRFVIFDLHSYNYRRGGPEAPAADPAENPDVNVGTGALDRKYWGSLVERFMADLRAFDFLGRHLDVRENVKFSGRQFGAWINARFPRSACVLSLEFKKFFMDEWTGQADPDQLKAILEALKSTVPGLNEELARR